MSFSSGVQSKRLLLIAAAIVLPVAWSWWALRVWVPAPPRHVTMATGPEGSAYARIGGRYCSILALF